MAIEPNIIYDDDPQRFLITWSTSFSATTTEMIETEPSIWWRKKEKALGRPVQILNTWYIGGGS